MDQIAKYPSIASGNSMDGMGEDNSRSLGTTQAALIFSFHILYKGIIGPTLHILGGAGFGCRYYPTCSNYCRDAFLNFSPWKAFKLSFLRIMRCNPWSSRDTFYPLPKLKEYR